VFAAVGFATLYNPFSQPRRLRIEFGVLAVTLLFAGVEFGRFFIPPAPLRLVSIQFGSDFQQESMRVAPALAVLEPGRAQQLYGLSAIKAPLGLSERVQHRWYKNGNLFWASPYYEVTGGREQGFRLWTRVTMDSIEPGTTIRIDVETEGGQLIGRGGIHARN
jgi:hypothetical protein